MKSWFWALSRQTHSYRQSIGTANVAGLLAGKVPGGTVENRYARPFNHKGGGRVAGGIQIPGPTQAVVG
jgi:hypothetical protein